MSHNLIAFYRVIDTLLELTHQRYRAVLTLRTPDSRFDNKKLRGEKSTQLHYEIIETLL